MKEKPDKCLCAFCQLERRIYRKKHISLINILLALAASVVVMAGFWQKLDPRVLILFVFFLVMAEIFIQVRWRLTLSCPFCGFDPVLYLKNPKKAASKVRVRLEDARDRGSTLLSLHNPWVNLRPVVKKQGIKRRAKTLSPVGLEVEKEP